MNRSLAMVLAIAGCSENSQSDASMDAMNEAATMADAVALSDEADAAPAPRVRTSCGTYVGKHTRAGVRAFLGIPFAAPPVGANRFRPPQPATCTEGERAAVDFGNMCVQRVQGAFAVPGPFGEDCLRLNVWTPDPAPTTPLPVMVFIYGGGFVIGGTNQAFYEGSQLAARGVVVVTINYRVGALGWLAHPALSAEDPQNASGNYGLLDQIAALQWVRREVAAFGGNPSNVTIFGESAGGTSVCSLLAAPAADGLFSRAIVQSGACVSEGAVAPLSQLARATAEERGQRYAASLGCTTGDIPTCLRSKSTEEILAMLPPFNANTWAIPFLPVLGSSVLPRSTRERLLDPTFVPPPLIVGSNRDEFKIFSLMFPVETEAAYRAAIMTAAGPFAESLLSIYPVRDYASPKEAFDALMRDTWFTCPARSLARLHAARQPRTYLYQYSHVNSGAEIYDVGATHAGELPSIFGNFSFPFRSPSANDRAMLALMQGYWTRFAATGDPNGAMAATWPAFTRSNDTRIELTLMPTTGTGLRSTQCDALDALR